VTLETHRDFRDSKSLWRLLENLGILRDFRDFRDFRDSWRL